MKYRNCLEGYLTPDCKDCCNWSYGSDGRSIGCNINVPIDWCPSFKKVYEEDSKNMRRLEKLKQERETIRNLECLSFDLIDKCTEYYDHEIECIEKYGSDNPEIKNKNKWIKHDYADESEGLMIPNYECPVCHSWERDYSKFCPDCGSNIGEEIEDTAI